MQRIRKKRPNWWLAALLVSTAMMANAQPRDETTLPQTSLERGDAKSLTLLERELLQNLPEDQLQAYLRGTPAQSIVLFSGESLASFIARQNVLGFTIPWYSIDAGGEMKSTNAPFTLSGSIGQPDVAMSTGGPFLIQGGFWASPPVCSSTTAVFCDSFETGNVSRWTVQSN